MMELSDEAVTAKAAIHHLTDGEKKEVLQQLNSELFPSDNTGRTLIWLVLLIGLFAIAVVSILVASNSGDDQESTAYISVASAVAAGVIGLFAKSPTA